MTTAIQTALIEFSYYNCTQSEMDDICSKQHHHNQNQSDQGQNDDTAHSASAFLHVYLGFIYISFCSFNIFVCSVNPLSYQVNFLSLFMCQNSDNLQQLNTFFNLLLEIQNLCSFLLDISEGICQDGRSHQQSSGQLLFFFFSLGYFLIELQFQIDFILDSSQQFSFHEIVLRRVFFMCFLQSFKLIFKNGPILYKHFLFFFEIIDDLLLLWTRISFVLSDVLSHFCCMRVSSLNQLSVVVIRMTSRLTRHFLTHDLTIDQTSVSIHHQILLQEY